MKGFSVEVRIRQRGVIHFTRTAALLLVCGTPIRPDFHKTTIRWTPFCRITAPVPPTALRILTLPPCWAQ